MATRTTNGTGGGLASATGTWSGAVVPITGDVVVIAVGDTVHWDTALAGAGTGILLGSNASGVGAAVTINGASGVSFGTLIVDNGATLYLRGFDLTTNTLMLVNRFGQFDPASGSTVKGDVASDYGSMILNKGQIAASGCTFTSPAANYSWGTAVTNETVPATATAWPYDPVNSVACCNLGHAQIGNAAGTGIGSFGNTSLTWGTQSPATILQTEVASLAAVNGAGKYFVNYDAGAVFFYHVYSAGNPSAKAAYTYLVNAKGWGIDSTQATTFNSCAYNNCVFNYMGATVAVNDRFAVAAASKLTAGANGAATDRVFSLTNCTFQWCNRAVSVKGCTGTAGDPLPVTGNTFYTSIGDTTYGYSIGAFRSSSDYLKIDSNVLNCREQFFKPVAPFAAVGTYNGFIFSNNTGTCGDVIGGTHGSTVFPDGVISNNTITGWGWATSVSGGRMFQGLGGTGGHRLVFSGNDFRYPTRTIHMASHLSIQSNVFGWSLHHVLVGDLTNNCLLSDVRVSNNLMLGAATASGGGSYNDSACQFGYNHQIHYDDVQFVNNTISDNNFGFVDFGDSSDATSVSVMTGVVVSNNLARMTTATGSTAIQRMANSATALCRIAGLAFDNNLDYNFATRYGSGAPKQGTFSGISNVAGVSLFNPSYGSGVSGKTLTLTVNSADADVTLAWDGGAAQQLIFATNGTGTATAGANPAGPNGINGQYSGTLTNGGAAWSTTLNNAACPSGHWAKVTGGTGAGQIRMITSNTATVLTTVPGWTVIPDNTSTYAIYKSEASLPNAGATQTVSAGVDLRGLPATTQSDTGVALTVTGSVTGSDPLLITPAGVTAAGFKITGTSPARDAATSVNAPALDYFGTTRPQGSAFDIGFHELPQATAYTLTGPSSGPLGTASGNFTVTPNALIVSAVITPSDSGGGGTFTPASLTFTNSSAAQTFTYTPGSAGAKTISTTNNGGLTDPGSLGFTVTATAYTFTGPASGAVGVASTNFTVTPNALVNSAVITPSDGGAGGTFTPASLTFTNSSAAQTFTYTPASAGAKTISTTNNGGLTDPAPLTYTAAAAGVAASRILLMGAGSSAGGGSPGPPPDPPGTADLRAYLAGDVPPGLYPEQLAGADLVLLGRPPQEAAFI